MTSGGWFEVGKTSDTLRSIGVRDGAIYWRKSKLGYIMDEHPEMTPEVVIQVPKIIEHPIVVLKSKTQPYSIVAFAELRSDGKPVMAALNLTPIPTGGMEAELAIIASAYGRSVGNASRLVESSDVLYLDENKNRTNTWLMSLGLQLPSGQPAYGPVGSITYSGRNVNIEGVPFRDLAAIKEKETTAAISANPSPGAASSTAAVSEDSIAYAGDDVNSRYSSEPERYSVDEEYAAELELWNRDGRPGGEVFVLGSTGEALQGLGAMEQDIYLRSEKINAILDAHPEMTLSEIKRLPF